jgi:hypothetical protein
MTVQGLIDQLTELAESGISGETEVKVWLPGSMITLGPSAFRRGGYIVVEGNVDPGSALEAL